MRAVDTSAWIEWATDGPLAKATANMFPGRDECLVPTIVQFELSKWSMRELDAERTSRLIAYTQKCVVVELDTAVALLAAALSRQHALSAADAIIYATALHHGADLLTCDAHFEGLDHVVYLRKVNA